MAARSNNRTRMEAEDRMISDLMIIGLFIGFLIYNNMINKHQMYVNKCIREKLDRYEDRMHMFFDLLGDQNETLEAHDCNIALLSKLTKSEETTDDK